MEKTLRMKRRRWNLGRPSRLDLSIFYFFPLRYFVLHGKSTPIKRWHGFDDAAVVDAGARRRRACYKH